MEELNRILVIAPESYPPTTGESIVTTKFLSALKSSGIELDIICNPEGLHFYPGSDNPELSSIKSDLINPYDRFHIFKKVFTKRHPIIWINLAIIVAIKTINRKKPSLIISRAMPIYGHMPALILQVMFRLPWLATWSDPMPLSVSPSPFTRKTKGIDFQKLYCKTVIRKATLHAFPNQHLGEYMQTTYPKLINKFIIVPHIASSDLSSNAVSTRRTFSLCHTGGLGIRDPRPFLLGLRNFIDRFSITDVELTFIGPFDTNAEAQVKLLGLEKDVIFIPAVSYQESLKLIQEFHVCVLIEANTETGIFLPSKVMDMIQSGKPILSVSPKRGVMATLLQNKRGGIAVDLNDIDKISDSIHELYSAWADGNLQEKYGSSCLRDIYSENKIISGFLSDLKRHLLK